jgi:tetratricopeptide (TPR) repeat protein
VDAQSSLALETATEKAIEALDWVIASYPGTDHMEEAYLKKGDVVFRVKRQPDEALEIYKLGLSRAKFYPTAFAERLGRLYLVTGDYDNAQAYFSRLIGQPSEELREAGVFYTGFLLSVKGEYQTARDTLVSLAEGNPASQFTNDAIQLSWVIEEGLQGEKKILDHYISGLRFEVADDTTAAIEEYSAILAYEIETPMRARALFRTGELYQGAGPPDRALNAFESFVRDYPADTRVPDAHRRIGQIYERDLGNVELALAKYEDILLTYPHYIFLDEVRADVIRLREQAGNQP